MHALEIDRTAEGDRGENGELMRGIDAVDVEARIGLGITQLLRLFQHLAEIAAAVTHLRQDVIAGAVQDAVDALDPVRREALAQRFQDRDAARHRRLEGERDVIFRREPGELVAVMRQHRLVRGNDVLARR